MVTNHSIYKGPSKRLLCQDRTKATVNYQAVRTLKMPIPLKAFCSPFQNSLFPSAMLSRSGALQAALDGGGANISRDGRDSAFGRRIATKDELIGINTQFGCCFEIVFLRRSPREMEVVEISKAEREAAAKEAARLNAEMEEAAKPEAERKKPSPQPKAK